MYFISLLFSLGTLITVLFMTYADAESHIFKFVGDTEIYVCIGLSILFIILGLLRDRRHDIK